MADCFSKIALVIIQENKTKIANFFKNILFFILKKHVPVAKNVSKLFYFENNVSQKENFA